MSARMPFKPGDRVRHRVFDAEGVVVESRLSGMVAFTDGEFLSHAPAEMLELVAATAAKGKL